VLFRASHKRHNSSRVCGRFQNPGNLGVQRSGRRPGGAARSLRSRLRLSNRSKNFGAFSLRSRGRLLGNPFTQGLIWWCMACGRTPGLWRCARFLSSQVCRLSSLLKESNSRARTQCGLPEVRSAGGCRWSISLRSTPFGSGLPNLLPRNQRSNGWNYAKSNVPRL
jgi:hypothetical protein